MRIKEMSDEQKKKLLDLKIECIFSKKKRKQKRKIQDVYVLVDRVDFLKSVENNRKELKLKKFDFKKNKIKKNKYKIKDVLDIICNNDPKCLEQFEQCVTKILKEFNLQYPYRKIVLEALVTGVVVDIVKLTHILRGCVNFNIPCIAFMPTPTTTKQEIIKAINTKIRWLYGYDKDFISTRYPDLHSNIEIMRQWYWERIEGKTYTKIAEDWAISQEPKEINTTYLDVLKSVKKYKKILNRDLHLTDEEKAYIF